MSHKIKELNNPNFEILLENVKFFKIDKIDIQMYKNMLLIYDEDKLVGLINYCITPSMKSKDKLFIRNIFCADNVYLNHIIKSLCYYCKQKKYSIFTTQTEKELGDECIKALYDNNFNGKNLIYHI
jgi:hypothetical protein